MKCLLKIRDLTESDVNKIFEIADDIESYKESLKGKYTMKELLKNIRPYNNRTKMITLEKIAQGNTAEVYVYSDSTICKLFSEGYPYEAVETEYRNSKILHQTTGFSPKAHKMISINGRTGIIYDRLFGKTLLQEMLENMTDQYILERLLEKMVMLQKQLIQIKNKECVSYKVFLKQLIPPNIDERNDIEDSIDVLENGDYICHGDFHPGNVWIYPDGSLDIIDCMNLCKGPKEYDIARTFFLFNEKGNDDEAIQNLKAFISNKYLEMMGKSTTEIADYLHVLGLCRRYEMGEF